MEINWFVAANFYDNDVAFVKNINQRHLRIGLRDKKHIRDYEAFSNLAKVSHL